MFRTVIWATDGSEAADRALPHATALSRCEGGALVVVHCKELLGGRSGGYPVYADENELVEKIRGQVDELRAAGVDASLKLASSPSSGAAHAIAEIVDEIGADVVVVGTRGHAPTVGVLLGSVAQRLLHDASCPVFAVPPPRGATRDEARREAVKGAL